MFDVTDDFEIVSVSDAAGVDQTLSAKETDALRYHVEAHFDGKLKVANRTMAIAT